jgi:hypothetical protein
MAEEGEVPYVFQAIEWIKKEGKAIKVVKFTSNAPCRYTDDKKVEPYSGLADVRYINRDSYEGNYKNGKKDG